MFPNPAPIPLLCTLLKLQGSQAARRQNRRKLMLCTLLKLQGSQAHTGVVRLRPVLCTLLKLQGSQAWSTIWPLLFTALYSVEITRFSS